MKRTTTEVLRRGFDSMLANWQLILVRIAESVLFLVIIIGSIIAAIVPIAISAGLSFNKLQDREPAAVIPEIIMQQWPLILFILLIASVVLLLLVGIHSFVDAGSAKVFVDAERIAAQSSSTTRDRFRSFTVERWVDGGKHSWWSVFWIYNIAWAVGGLIMLIPLLGTLVLMLLFSDSGPKVAAGCIGLAVSLLLMIPIVIVTAIWTQKAITIAVSRVAGAMESLRLGWSALGRDTGRHVAVAFIVFVIAFGGAMAISMMTLPLSIARHHPPLIDLAFAPAQMGISLLQSIFSAAVGLWFLASYVGLTEER